MPNSNTRVVLSILERLPWFKDLSPGNRGRMVEEGVRRYGRETSRIEGIEWIQRWRRTALMDELMRQERLLEWLRSERGQTPSEGG